jgi:hypothetical protein
MRTVCLLAILSLLAGGGFVAAACDDSGTKLSPADAGPECGDLDADNADACPAAYGTAGLSATCAPIGLVCLYPGQGDGTSTGCAATAALSCLRNEDAEVGQWVANQ